MGYTHYFPHMRSFTDAEWSAITDATQRILAYNRVPLAWEFDQPDKPPQIDDEFIRFNGVGRDGHETFVIYRDLAKLAATWDYYATQYRNEGRVFVFCKTAAKPYDTVVTAVLSAIATLAPGALDIGSDGEPRDWRAGVALANRALLREIAIPALDNN